MCSEMSPPRLSFSHDLSDSELQVFPLKQDVHHCKDSDSSEFEFITSNTLLEFESPSADELFSNGVILPIQIQQDRTTKTATRKQHSHNLLEAPHTRLLPPRPCSSSVDKMKKDTIREILHSDHEKEPHHSSKSFWGFSRSKSLNCDRKKSLICSLPLLSRSNSTGSASNPKKMSSNKQQSSCSAKSPSGKSYGGSYGNGVWINVPTPYVSKGTSNLFGLGSFLRVRKVKK